MFIAFRTFRRIILGIILLVSIVSLTLSLYLKPSFVHPNSAYVMVGILDVLIFASILSIFRRTLFDSPQLVATETLGLFTLLPFALILALYVLTVSVTSDSNAIRIFTVLQIFIFIGTILHGLYTMGLAVTAMFTVCAFDQDVWSRDIDSSPSPFPMSVLFSFVFPCFPSPASTPFPTDNAPEHQNLVCLPGCNCSTAKTSAQELGNGTGLEPTADMCMLSGVSSRSLVRVPNDVERRTSIIVAFEV